MIKYSIKKNNVITNVFTSELGDENYHEACFGKKAGVYNINELSEQELATEISRELVSSPYNIDRIMVTIPNQYEIIIVDISAEELAKKESQEALEYLKATDYLVLKSIDNRTPYPQAIKDARAAARLKVL